MLIIIIIIISIISIIIIMMMMMMMMMKILSLTERHNLELTMERKLWKKNVGTLLAVDEQ